MKMYQTLACTLLGSLLITACDGGLDYPSANGNNYPSSNSNNDNPGSMTLRMPKSLQSSDDSGDAATPGNADEPHSKDETDIREAARETMGEVSDVAEVLDASSTGASIQALYLGADLLYERVEFAEEILDDIDDIWDAILSYCTSSSDNDTCEIPAGTLVDDTGELLNDAAITYTPNPDDTYAHSLSRTIETEDNEIEQIRWNDDRSRISMSYQNNWQDENDPAEQSSHLLYSDGSDGIRVSLRDEVKMGGSSFTDFQQLHALHDELNSVEIITEFNWTDADDSGRWQAHAVANDLGGKLGTTATFADDPVKWHTRETFDEDGRLASSEYCEETQGIDCSEPANWSKVEVDYDNPLNFNVEDADYDLHEAYLEACDEMDIEDCGFSESGMVIIDGAVDLFENTDDVIVYLCIETGEDELICQSQTDDESPAEQFTTDPGSINSVDTPLDTDDTGELEIPADTDQDCGDCVQDLVNTVFDIVNAEDFADSDYACDAEDSANTETHDDLAAGECIDLIEESPGEDSLTERPEATSTD